ncbi:helix-turn-helix domain-containing protein [uncultured Hyphomonas sp.]|uniref:TetR/AcrR family transcriptional regulator n=1 Tax=uncultured Hyphomonas sp. TaxID=225298 RepID=UPI002AAB09EB|nr:helix-turn-helix domain-containing protein [uncultured Hyphomonas sp.]
MTSTSTLPDIGRRERAKEERRQRIVRAVRDLIRETGDTNPSMRLIASRAEVSIATAYNLFGSKQAVVLAVLEDKQTFAERLASVKAQNPIDMVFVAHELAVSYYTQDPEFYRPLWRALLDSSGKSDMSIVPPERQAETRAAWRSVLMQAQNEGYLDKEESIEWLERSLTHSATGAMLSWATEALPTEALLPSAGLGYAYILSAAATAKGKTTLKQRIAAYKSSLP